MRKDRFILKMILAELAISFACGAITTASAEQFIKAESSYTEALEDKTRFLNEFATTEIGQTIRNQALAEIEVNKNMMSEDEYKQQLEIVNSNEFMEKKVLEKAKNNPKDNDLALAGATIHSFNYEMANPREMKIVSGISAAIGGVGMITSFADAVRRGIDANTKDDNVSDDLSK